MNKIHRQVIKRHQKEKMKLESKAKKHGSATSTKPRECEVKLTMVECTQKLKRNQPEVLGSALHLGARCGGRFCDKQDSKTVDRHKVPEQAKKYSTGYGKKRTGTSVKPMFVQWWTLLKRRKSNKRRIADGLAVCNIT